MEKTSLEFWYIGGVFEDYLTSVGITKVAMPVAAC